jgi:hypothetical protein
MKINRVDKWDVQFAEKFAHATLMMPETLRLCVIQPFDQCSCARFFALRSYELRKNFVKSKKKFFWREILSFLNSLRSSTPALQAVGRWWQKKLFCIDHSNFVDNFAKCALAKFQI